MRHEAPAADGAQVLNLSPQRVSRLAGCEQASTAVAGCLVLTPEKAVRLA